MYLTRDIYSSAIIVPHDAAVVIKKAGKHGLQTALNFCSLLMFTLVYTSLFNVSVLLFIDVLFNFVLGSQKLGQSGGSGHEAGYTLWLYVTTCRPQDNMIPVWRLVLDCFLTLNG